MPTKKEEDLQVFLFFHGYSAVAVSSGVSSDCCAI